MKTLKFKCSKCGGKILEEVMVDVVMSSVIKKICSGDLEYDSNIEIYDGEVNRYQCEKCGRVITDEVGNTINKLDELIEWLGTLETNKKG